MLPLTLLCLAALLCTVSATLGSTETGVVLHSDDEKTRSGVLSQDHRCAEFPSQFPGKKAQNVGRTHCGLWTNEDCSGTLHVVPAHYTIDLPEKGFKSVIC